MKRYKQPYTLFKRGKIWYYRLAKDPKRIPHSTGKTVKSDAARFAETISNKRNWNAEAKKTLREYLPEALEKYIDMRAIDGDPLNESHCQDYRRYLRYILEYDIADLKLEDIKVANVQDFKSKLVEQMKNKRNTANRVLTLMKMLLRIAYERQEIERDPSGGSRGIRRISTKSRTRAIYTKVQLEKLFPPDLWEEDRFHPWSDIYDYTAFLLTASTGLRRKEILGLHWDCVFLEEDEPYIVVSEELAKSKKRRATPFFDKVVFGDNRAVRAMKHLRYVYSNKTSKVMTMEGTPIEGYVFGYVDGSPRKTTWWKDHLLKALENAQIDRGGDVYTMPLDAHSFRHTLASSLKAIGMPDSLIRVFCGWSSLNVQSDYTHIDSDLIHHYTQWMKKHAL
jgi:integrase